MILQAAPVAAQTWADYVAAVFDSDPAFTGPVRAAIRASRCFEAARQVWRVGGHHRTARRLFIRAVLDAAA